MTPEQMRSRAAEQRQAAKARSREAMDLDRAADQLDYEAGLIDAADRAEAALEAVRSRLPGLDAAVEGATTAAAEKRDALDAAERFLATARAAEAEADETRADPGVRADAAVRAAKALAMADEARRELAIAEQARDAARQARVAYVTEDAEATRAYAAAAAAAANPGTAPRTSPLALGLGRPDDMSTEERQLVAAAILALSASSSAPAGTARPVPRPRMAPASGSCPRREARWRSRCAGPVPDGRTTSAGALGQGPVSA